MPNMINLSFLRSLPVNYVQPFATVATHSTRQSLVSYRNTMSQKISKEGRTSKMFTCILQQQLYEGRRSTRPWPEVWHSPRLPRWDGPRSSKAPSWYRLKYVVIFLFAQEDEDEDFRVVLVTFCLHLHLVFVFPFLFASWSWWSWWSSSQSLSLEFSSWYLRKWKGPVGGLKVKTF